MLLVYFNYKWVRIWWSKLDFHLGAYKQKTKKCFANLDWGFSEGQNIKFIFIKSRKKENWTKFKYSIENGTQNYPWTFTIQNHQNILVSISHTSSRRIHKDSPAHLVWLQLISNLLCGVKQRALISH